MSYDWAGQSQCAVVLLYCYTLHYEPFLFNAKSERLLEGVVSKIMTMTGCCLYKGSMI